MPSESGPQFHLTRASLWLKIRAIWRDSFADHPLVLRPTFEQVVAEYQRGRGAIVVGRHAGKRGHPVIFSRPLFAELLAAPEEQGAKVVVNRDPQRIVYVDVDDPGVTLDLDTPADLERVGLAGPPQQ